MKPENQITLIAATVALLGTAPAFAQSGEAAQVIFTNDKLTVIDARGVERVAKQGDFIQPGERLITPPGVVGQIKLPDGTLLGARPGSDIKLESIVRALGKNVLVLNEGNVRVVNVEPPKGPKPMPVDVVSPISTLQLTGGDGEAIHVKPGNTKPDVEPGTYNRLQLGTAIVRNDKGELPLPPMQSIFAPRQGVPLAPIAFLPPTLIRLGPVSTVSVMPSSLISTNLNLSSVGDLRAISSTSLSAINMTNLAGVNPGPLPGGIDAGTKTNLGTFTATGTSGSPIISQTLAGQYQIVNVNTLTTASLGPSKSQVQPISSIPLCVRSPSLCQTKKIR